MENNRASHYGDPFCVRQAAQLRRLLEKQVAACDTAIAELIAAAAKLRYQAERLDAIPGVGAITAATVLAEVPELGRSSDAAVAALVGGAPFNRDRVAVTGVRHLAGGRGAVRCARYMATLSAVKHAAILKKIYRHLRAADKKPEAALVAGMRKLIILMNRLLKNPKFQLEN